MPSKRLAHLDVHGNELIRVSGLQHLAALTYLDLSGFLFSDKRNILMEV